MSRKNATSPLSPSPVYHAAVNAMPAHEYQALTRDAEVLSQDRHGPKVLALPDGRCVKLFRRKRLISSTTLFPYAKRFEVAAIRLSQLGIPTVRVDSVSRIASIKRDAVVYHYLEGTPLRETLAQADGDGIADLLERHAEFLADLHDKGIYFRAIHFNNVVVCPDGAFGLIDISEARCGRRPLGPAKRARNFRPMTMYAEDRDALRAFGHARFIARYLEHVRLSPRAAKAFKARLPEAFQD